ncbi:MAG: metalloprotease [Candidatus Nanoarchaeia archaeon]|nr:metalloprotease [Candidatus Nanoarchaeia archaeon]
MKTSKTEIISLVKAWIAISIAFSVILTKNLFSIEIVTNFLIASLTVGCGFILHEMAHKYLAQRYGAFAEFRSFDFMLLLTIIMSFFGFVFAAPGAVMISGNINKEKNGKISAIGPLTNLLLALVFLLISFSTIDIIKLIGVMGFTINSWLGLFNMIPFWQFDGMKIYNWNKIVYFSMLIFAIGLMVVSYL